MGPGLSRTVHLQEQVRSNINSEDNMTKKNTLAGLILLVAGSLLIAACTPQQTPTTAPTIDANMIYTQAAETVQAGLAQTPVPPTSAPTETVAAATATMDQNMALALTATAQSVQPGGATATLGANQPSATPGTGAAGAKATATKTTAPVATKAVVVSQPKTTGDKAELIGQDPGDGSKITRTHEFNVHLTFKTQEPPPGITSMP